jgi:ATP-dependent Clp protease ATP-binding subunit ClpB
VDELHTVVGAGAAEGAMDAGNMLKPLLARGELHLIGATTLDEYRKYVEKDAALERRFQPVGGGASVECNLDSARPQERYEVHHGVRIKDAALVTAAVLSHRYISDRFLPDKAIDLVDESAAKLRTEIDSMPTELDEVSRRVITGARTRVRAKRGCASRDRLGNWKRAGGAEIGARPTRPIGRWENKPSVVCAASRRRSKTNLAIDQAQRE